MVDQPVTREKLIKADIDVDNLGKAMNELGIVNPRYGEAYPTLPSAIQTVIESGGFEPFTTEAELKASVPVLEKKAAYSLDTHKIWLWTRTSAEGANPVTGTWTDTGLSAVDQAKQFTVEKIVETVTLKKSDDPSIFNIVNDGAGNSLVYIDKATGVFHAVGLYYTVFNQIFALKKYANSNYAPISVDANGNMLAWINKITHKFEAVGLNSSSQSQQKNYKYFLQKPVVAEMNHLVGYGQSLKTGATATVILSTSQPYANVTFNTGPRKDSAATSLIPLVEQFNNPSSDGYANRGETCCSGAANYASRAMMKEDGINPSKHVIFASTAAHGGYRIDQLKKGSPWYSFFLEHITEAKRLSDSKTYKTQAVDWGQGENDAVTGGIQTPYGVYKPELAQLQIDATNDIKAITGQQDSVPFITYQMSYSAATWPDIAKAQLDLVRENDFFMLSTPMYHFPYAGDKVHLTNVGYKWFGAYVGRAYKQYVIEGRKSDFINPLSAQIAGNQIIIKFDVPTLPLQIDTATLASTTNAGFKVMNGASEIAITSVTASDDTVTLQLASTPTDNVQVRYALDYLGAGLAITGGASGNLRDSTSDSIEITGVTKPLYHVCPHFELTAFLDKGI